ncbi:proline-rich protein 5-like isoform X1 [Lagenorhynchus albirostris]|uniref:proline-rich protein 5-like isoform X1 n=2 Tax=Lagenorhynchus albirostris TaxID=27610 RepID=UPI0028E4A576|nr:proline-rich protein 5-like isoform X1 [Lagenorhynchus albirostris]XP_060015364.1 proline-rich protein 5-like isoform X1 [Lagenorhynchus albirostris]XP_060015365.1 proline-rich protein 5-like isoform X1 [Lagenorhynchus albirostris]
MTRGFAPSLPVEFPKMGSFRRPRPRFMSSPALSDLPRFQAARQALQLSSNSAWNSVQTAVINVFKGGGLQSNELYTLNENIRRLLKSELGSFITDYFQNQLLAKGLLFVEEKIKLFVAGSQERRLPAARLKDDFIADEYSILEVKGSENRMEVLADVWDHFFTETLPTLQAIFYPVQLHPAPLREDLKHLCGWFTPCVHRLLPSLQYSLFGQQWVLRRHTREGQELTIRQISLLGFRDLVLLKVKLDDLLLLAQPQLPSSIVQMLLILQSVHEPTGPSEGYLQLEELVKQVVSPFLGISEDRSVSGPTYTLARRHSRARPKVTLLSYASPMTAVSRPLNEMALTPLTEQEGEAYLEKCGSVRRHTVANAHSDIQLLAMATRMHSGLGEEPGGEDKCLLLPPSFPPPHRQCSSEPNITDGPDEPEQVAAGSQEDSELNCSSLS